MCPLSLHLYRVLNQDRNGTACRSVVRRRRFGTLLRYMNQTQRQRFDERGVPCLTQVRHANWLVSVVPAW